MSRCTFLLLLLASLSVTAFAFVPSSSSSSPGRRLALVASTASGGCATTASLLRSSAPSSSDGGGGSRDVELPADLSSSPSSSPGGEPEMNPDNPVLPRVQGDFDWDARFGGDEDWVTGDAVPGKRALSGVELARQAAALGQLEDRWRGERERREYEEGVSVGFVPTAEIVNGRTAMFFLVTGLLTEYWTGVSLPGQVEEMLRIGGFIGFGD